MPAATPALTGQSVSWKWRITPMRSPFTPPFRPDSRSGFGRFALDGSAGSWPVSASSRMAQSSTVQASGPTVSRLCDSGSTPTREHSP